MRINLTNHAIQRMSERGISKKQVAECLGNFGVSRPGEGKKRVYDYIDEQGYKTSVSATVENGEWVVVSVWRVKAL